MNETEEHLVDDIKRLDHADSNVMQGVIVHFYRLSNAKQKFSGRDWSPNSSRILIPEQVRDFTIKSSAEVYYGMADSTGKYENGAWHISRGQMTKNN
jgi:hypothetical protein